MRFLTNKEKGNTALGMAIAYFTSQGHTVSLPLNDTQDYDLVVQFETGFKSIQVKSSGCKTKYGIYQVALKSCGGTKGKRYKTLINTNIDYLFVFLANRKMYLLPKQVLSNESTLNLGSKYDNYQVFF